MVTSLLRSGHEGDKRAFDRDRIVVGKGSQRPRHGGVEAG